MKSKATVTLSGGGKSVTIDADKLAQVAKQVGQGRGSQPAATAQQQSFGFDVTHGFLGEEFLLWIWWKFETDGGEFTLPGGRVVGVAIDDVLVFAPKSEDDTQQTLRRGLPTRTPEARTALRHGHRIAKARLLLAEASRQWTCTLDGERMAFGAVKLPDDDDGAESAEDRTTDRAANWLALHEIVAALFGQFLRVRVGDGWKREAEQIALWMAQ